MNEIPTYHEKLLTEETFTEKAKGLSYFKLEIHGQWKEAFLANKLELLYRDLNDLLAKNKKREENIASSTSSTIRSFLKITLPKFSDAYHDWLYFRNLF